MNCRTGHLYRLDQNGHKALLDNLGASNGLVWNGDGTKFYYVDSLDFDLKEFDYDIETGEIKNLKVLLNIRDLPQVDGKQPMLDGITVDSNGFLYVTVFGGSSVYKVDPKNGNIVLDIKFACDHITSVAFGGPNLDILYVTSAVKDKPAPAGETFQVTGLGTNGLPMIKYKL